MRSNTLLVNGQSRRFTRQKPGSSRTIEQILDRRGRPFGPAARGALMQLFKLTGDFPQGQVRVR